MNLLWFLAIWTPPDHKEFYFFLIKNTNSADFACIYKKKNMFPDTIFDLMLFWEHALQHVLCVKRKAGASDVIVLGNVSLL